MRRLTALVMLTAVVLVEAPSASAGGRRHPGTVFVPGKSHGFVGKNTTGSLSAVPRDPWKSWGVPVRQRVHLPDRRDLGFVPFVPFGGSSIALSSSVSSPTVIIYDLGSEPFAGPAVAAAAAVPPVPTLVEYAEGWYQLQGDGFSAPYRWVWIPRPPPPPLAAVPAPPAGPPAAGPAPDPAPSGPRIQDTYSWTDEQGVTSWTNRPERIPPRYRDQTVPQGTGAAR
jgi:hypothetical protein